MRMSKAMSDLFVLLRDLGDHIASKSDGAGNTPGDDDDPVESRFRSVLPNLLEGYLVPFKGVSVAVIFCTFTLKEVIFVSRYCLSLSLQSCSFMPH